MPKPVSMQAARPPTESRNERLGRPPVQVLLEPPELVLDSRVQRLGTPSRSGRLGCGDGDSVRWHDLRLEGENVAALGVDECLHPLHVVVVAAGLVWGAGLEGVI